jgi:hypothetical protein
MEFFMKKIVLFSLSLLMLTSAVQPAFGMEQNKPSAKDRAKDLGAFTGFATAALTQAAAALTTGAAYCYVQKTDANPNIIAAVGLSSIIGFNAASAYLNRRLQKSRLAQNELQKIHNTDTKTPKTDLKQLEKAMQKSAYKADLSISSLLMFLGIGRAVEGAYRNVNSWYIPKEPFIIADTCTYSVICGVPMLGSKVLGYYFQKESNKAKKKQAAAQNQ